MGIEFLIFFIQILLFLLLLLWGAKKDKRFLYLLAFLIPLMSLSVNVGVLLTWQRLIFPIAIFALVLGKYSLCVEMPAMRFLKILIGYIIILTVFLAVLDYMNGRWYVLGRTLGWGLAQSTYRYWIQLGTVIGIWGVAFIPVWFVHSKDDLKAVMNGYISGNLFSVLLGFYQITALRWGLPGSDFNWFIGAERGAFQDYGASNWLGTEVYRLSGLGGEPKHIGSFILSALILILALELFAPEEFGVHHAVAKISILTLGMVLTFSSGTWTVSLIILLLLFTWAILKGRGSSILYISVFGLFIASAFLLLGGESLQNIVNYRVGNRLSGGVASFAQYEPKDGAFIYFAQENPNQIILGAGAGGLDFRLIPYVYELNPNFLQKGGTTTPAYFFTRFLGEFGIVGLLFFMGLITDWLRLLANSPNYTWGRPFVIVAIFALFGATSVSLMGYLLIASSIVVLAGRSEVAEQQSETIHFAYRQYRKPLITK